VIVEAKYHASNINKDTTMKLIHIQQDLSADRAVLATTSGFTSGALQTAKQYKNVELWDGAKTAALLGEIRLDEDTSQSVPAYSAKTVEAEITLEEVTQYANEAAAKRSRGGMFGVGKIEESVKAVTKFLYPYYDVDVNAKVKRVEKTGWFSEEEIVSTTSGRIGVDGNTGSVIHVVENGISYEYHYLSVRLDKDEIRTMHHAAKEKVFEKRNFSPEGWTGQRTNRAVNGLTEKGLLIQTGQRPATYMLPVEYPHDPLIFKSLIESFPVTEYMPDDKKLEVSILPEMISAGFDGLWPGINVKAIDLVYYPYYMVVYERPDGSTRHEIHDGVFGTRHEDLADIVSENIE